MLGWLTRRRRTLGGVIQYAKDNLDPGRLEIIREAAVPWPNERKYMDTEGWLRRLWKPASMLRLTRARKRLRILDLGTGAGHFPFICGYLGHDARGLDRPGSAFYDAMSDWMGVAITRVAIEPFKPLPPFEKKFDLITAF